MQANKLPEEIEQEINNSQLLNNAKQQLEELNRTIEQQVPKLINDFEQKITRLPDHMQQEVEKIINKTIDDIHNINDQAKKKRFSKK